VLAFIRFKIAKPKQTIMKKKYILAAFALGLSISAKVMAQVPSYVPTNGLVGWWPFSGNANDASGNGNNGTESGTTLAQDRYSNNNSAYSFDGINDLITIPHSSSLSFTGSEITISYWVKLNSYQTNGKWNNCIYKASYPGLNPFGFRIGFNNQNSGSNMNFYIANGSYTTARTVGANYQTNIGLNNWRHVVFTNDNNILKLYIDGMLISQNTNNGTTIGSSNDPLYFGGPNQPNTSTDGYFAGLMDDIGIWNRALTQQEITDLYNSLSCSNDLVITPQNNTSQTGGSASFTATTSDPNPSFVWQSDFGQGFQTLNNFGNYSGVNSATLNIANVQLSEHLQPIRVISTSGNCVDTSNIATISILDTCLTSINDTTFITVTDTLVINTQITGINPPNNSNTIKVYPNPASDHITIDNGNYIAMAGYSIKIENNAGQQVFQSLINQAQFYVDLSTWSGNGLYFVHLIDAQGNTVTVRKIVLQ